MGCYSNAMKARCAKVVIGISVILGILGLVFGIFGLIQAGLVKPPKVKEDFDFDINPSTFGYLAIVAGVFLIGTSVLGCMTGKFKKPCFALPYLIATGVLCLILFIFGAVALAGRRNLNKVRDDACKTAGAGDLKQQYKDTIDRYTCSSECPCAAGEGDSIKNLWYSYNDDKFRKSNRKKEGQQGNQHDVVFRSDGETYSSFSECYKKKLRKEKETRREIKKFYEQGLEEFFNAFEENYDCASVCDKPLFYMTVDVSSGAPNEECGSALIKSVNKRIKPVGVVAIISGVVVLIAFIGTFPLCTGFDDKSEE